MALASVSRWNFQLQTYSGADQRNSALLWDGHIKRGTCSPSWSCPLRRSGRHFWTVIQMPRGFLIALERDSASHLNDCWEGFLRAMSLYSNLLHCCWTAVLVNTLHLNHTEIEHMVCSQQKFHPFKIEQNEYHRQVGGMTWPVAQITNKLGVAIISSICFFFLFKRMTEVRDF